MKRIIIFFIYLFFFPFIIGQEKGENNFDKSKANSNNNVIINEILASNVATFPDEDFGEYSDWIELLNLSDETVILDGFYISDDKETPKWRFPDGAKILPNSTLIIWADNQNINKRELHTNFRLENNGEWLGLFNSEKEIVDSITFDAQLEDVSYGRTTNGWAYFANPTPGISNNTWSCESKVFFSKPSFSLISGFYTGSQTLALSAPENGGEIRYTTDGSNPNIFSSLYFSQIVIDSTVVIKARTFSDGLLPSAVVTNSYFINETTELPVVSISSDPRNFWDDNIGMYAIGNNGLTFWGVTANYWQEWERPIHIEYFENDKQRKLIANCGIAINGMRRNMLPKSFRVMSREKYGYNTLPYKFFNSKPIDEYKSLILRNGGYPDFISTIIRDGMMQGLLDGEMDIDKQAFKQSVLFLNGQYWGIYNIREKQNEDYLYYNHNVDPNNVDILELKRELYVIEGDANHYNNLLDYIGNHDMKDSSIYNYVKTQIDIEEYQNYQIAQIYFANNDWPGNNNKFWRPKTTDGKWRWIMFDVEAGFGMWGRYDHNTIELATDVSNQVNENATFLFRKLLENQDFKNEFIQKFAVHLNTTFNKNRVIPFIDSIKSNIEAEMPRHIEKWATGCSTDDPFSSDGCTVYSFTRWKANINALMTFARVRSAHISDYITDFFNLEGKANLNIQSNSSESGRIRVMGKEIPAQSTGRSFFKNIPLKIEAVPSAGFKFIEWEGLPNTASSITEIVLTHDSTITAQFEKVKEIVLNSHIIENTVLFNHITPYSVNGDLIIDSTSTLTLNKGITLLMSEGASIYVNGGLMIKGSSDNPVVIKTKLSSNENRWGAICFNQSKNISSLSHLKIIGANKGKHPINQKAAISSYKSVIKLDHIEFEKIDFPIFVQYGKVTLTNSIITTNVTSDLINVKYGEARIENCELIGNNSEDTDGIDYDGVINGIIKNNRIYGFSGNNSDGIDLGEKSLGILIQNNFIHDCYDKGISAGQQATCVIENNVIVNCYQGIAVKDKDSYSYIDHNTFYNNNIAVSAYEKIPGNGGGNIDVTNSIISQSIDSPFFYDHLSNITISYSLSDGIELPGESNLVANALFINEQANDFRLGRGSPALDAGDPSSPLDPDGTRTNMGAYYYDYNRDIDIVINEINYHSHNNFDPKDWIELYNPSENEVEISNWIFKDSDDEHIFRIADRTTVERNSYYTLCEDSSEFKKFFPDAANYQGNFNFGLNNGGEKLRLYDCVGNLIDSLTYGDKAPWPSKPDGNGNTLGLIDPTSDNSLFDNWGSTRIFGTPGEANIFNNSSDTSNILFGNYQLFQNYPNPFNATTTIKFELPKRNDVKLILYDILGREIVTLVDGIKLPGRHEVLFNAGRLSSGVYFYKFTVENYTSVKKLLLLK